MKTLKKINDLETKKVGYPANQGRVSYAQAVKSTPTVTSSPVIRQIMPVVMRFIEWYLEQICSKSQASAVVGYKTLNPCAKKQCGYDCNYLQWWRNGERIPLSLSLIHIYFQKFSRYRLHIFVE